MRKNSALFLAAIFMAASAHARPTAKERADILSDAAARGAEEEVIRFLDEGYDINGFNSIGTTPLVEAASWTDARKDARLVRLLLDRGAKPDLAGKDGETPLMRAVWKGTHLTPSAMDAAKMLLEAGASPNRAYEKGETLLHQAVSEAQAPAALDLVQALIVRGAKLDAKDDEGRTPLMSALKHHLLGSGDVSGKAAALCLNAGASPNGAYKNGETPLIKAIKGRDVDLAKLLLEKGADPRGRSDDGKTPLMLALGLTEGKGRALAKLLLENPKTDAWSPDSNGSTPLMEAAGAGFEDIMERIFFHDRPKDFKVDAKNNFGVTALMFAAFSNHAPAVRRLLRWGADPRLRDQRGHTPLVRARLDGHEEVAKILEEFEASLSGAAPGGAVTKADIEKIVAAVSGGARPGPAGPKASSDADAPSYSMPADPDNYALVVGIEKYDALPDAAFAERDAQAVRAHLSALGFSERNIVTLTGTKATKTGLAKNLETWLPRNAVEKSTVFFFYSGHGAPDPATGQAYLVPFDGDPQYLPDTAYPVKRLYEMLNALKAKKIVVVLDSCFSGAGGRSVLAKGTRPLVNKVDVGQARTGKVASLTASQADQVSGTAEEQGHGLFTYYLLRGLNGAAKDSEGAVTIQGLFDYILPNVQDRARRDNREQSPQLNIGSQAPPDLRLR